MKLPICAALIGGLICSAALAETPAKRLFGAATAPSPGPARVFGTYARGCLQGAVKLPDTGPTWQAMRLGRNRHWGHPALIAFIGRLSMAARRAGWPGLYVGDMAQPRGGPMLSGHRSHQIGLDVDIWMLKPRSLKLSRARRESISSISVLRADRLGVNRNWTSIHHAVLRAAAKDPAVARIFVTAAVKKAMCEASPPGDRAWLRKIRPWWGHRTHFHVRLHCPKDSPDCREQKPPPPGDGCGKELAWWFSDEALHPKPPKEPPKPRPELTLADLPPACRGVLAAQ
ncbi:MAG: penicillin-insensitive murein endopeptidase [Alphaproteobacteria bacterium]|nr:MAG: penicillin-insensitive murein endopeptidase [Alphaproteobacteria bacterium]